MKRTDRARTATLTRLAMVASVSLAACAGTPLTTEAPSAEIRAAQEVGAADVPQAALHLQLAKEELARAKHLSAAFDSTLPTTPGPRANR